MHRKRRETPYTVCHVPADASLSFTALVIITIKTHRISQLNLLKKQLPSPLIENSYKYS